MFFADLISNDINTESGLEIIKSGKKPPKPDGLKLNPRLKEDLEYETKQHLTLYIMKQNSKKSGMRH